MVFGLRLIESIPHHVVHRDTSYSNGPWFFLKQLGEATLSPQLSYFDTMYSYYIFSHCAILHTDVSWIFSEAADVSNQLVRCTVTLPPLGIIFQFSFCFSFTLPWLELSFLLLTEDVGG